MKLGILGTGMIVKDLLTTINKLKIESISILGTEQTKKETTILAKQYHLDHCYYDYDEMLIQCMLPCQIIYILVLLKKLY